MCFFGTEVILLPFYLYLTDFFSAQGDIFRSVLPPPFQCTNGVMSAQEEIPFWSCIPQSDFVDGPGLSESRDHKSGCGAINIAMF